MRFSLSALILVVAALASNSPGIDAAPLHGNETSVYRFHPRGSAQSTIVKDLNQHKKCPTQRDVNNIAHQLNGDLKNALFYSRVSLPVVQTVRTHYRKKYLQDVFPSAVFDAIRHLCEGHPNYSSGDPLMLMSKGMAYITTGEAWILGDKTSVLQKTVLQDGGAYFKAEMDVLKSQGKVHTVLAFYYEKGQLLPQNGVKIRL
ncbi:hypothetical protein VKT23_016752 [Stygiomarasmius scandens]|uniref:Secreted protein n=1 Tax=Marasmiellus scandens TaxID=2682957 RepID=A0ABR1IWT2_9AGAR